MSTENISPTRISLIKTKKTLKTAKTGCEVLEHKRDILIRELRDSIYHAEQIRKALIDTLTDAYYSLREANIAKGTKTISDVVLGSSFRANYLVNTKSIMGVAVPTVEFQSEKNVKPEYGFANTTADLDKAFELFYDVLKLVGDLAAAEGTTYQLANDINKTQRRVNALNYVLIPKYHDAVKWIELVLEEKEREEFIRTKRIKSMIQNKQ